MCLQMFCFGSICRAVVSCFRAQPRSVFRQEKSVMAYLPNSGHVTHIPRWFRILCAHHGQATGSPAAFLYWCKSLPDTPSAALLPLNILLAGYSLFVHRPCPSIILILPQMFPCHRIPECPSAYFAVSAALRHNGRSH